MSPPARGPGRPHRPSTPRARVGGRLRAAGFALLAAALGAAPLAAQQPPDTASVLDGVYTQRQAARGEVVYERYCALCHFPREFSGPVFQLTWGTQRLGALFSHVRNTMPLDNPGSLTPEQYAQVVAYILKLNGYPVGEKELPPEPSVLSRIRMERPPDSARVPQPRERP